MITESPSKDARASVGPRRALFNRPTWAKTSSDENDDLFRRSNRMYTIKIAEKERRHQNKSAKWDWQSKACNSASDRGQLRCPDADEASRIEDGIESETSHLSKSGPLQNSGEKMPTIEILPSSTAPALLEQYDALVAEAELSNKRSSENHTSCVNNLKGYSEVESHIDTGKHVKRGPIISDRTHVTESAAIKDDEFTDLARQAREIARRKRLELDLLQIEEIPIAKHRKVDLPYSAPPHSPRATVAKSDSTIQILITSSIEHTRPLIITRKLSQRLKDVRIAWIQYQIPHHEALDRAFLTWRGTRLFDVTSCQSLVTVSENGSIISKGEILGIEEARLHMVAMTPEIYDTYKKSKDSQPPQEQSADECVSLPEPRPKNEPQIRIILRAKGLSDFKLIVKPVSDMLIPYQILVSF